MSELVRGQTLREELAGAARRRTLLTTLIDLAAGLAAAHAAGIVHRDFKPENIVRCTDGRVKILDFGLARAGASEPRLTQTGLALGTPGYMPPEQLTGQDVDARTDIFAFGVVAGELATGAHPFGANAAEMLAHMTDLLEGRAVTTTGPPLPSPGSNRSCGAACAETLPSATLSAEPLLQDLQALRVSGAHPVATLAYPPKVSHPALRWWQIHQGVIAAVIAAMPVATWFVRSWNPPSARRWSWRSWRSRRSR